MARSQNKKFKSMTKEQVFGIIRHAFTLVGGILIAKGLVDEGSWTEVTGSAISLVGVVWSILEKRKS